MRLLSGGLGGPGHVEAAPAGGSLVVNAGRLDATLAELERAGDFGRLAVIVSDPRDHRVLYLYNPGQALRGLVPPGSLMKPLAAAALLASPGFQPGRRVVCRGRFPIDRDLLERRDLRGLPLTREGDRFSFGCSLRAGHGPVDLRAALVQSCNVYFLTQAAERPELYARLRSGWHLAGVTGARDLGAERASLAVEPGRLTRLQRSLAIIGEGGGLRLTPLKISQVYGALFTNGALLRPGRTEPAAGQFPRPFSRAILARISGILGEVPESGTLRGLTFPGPEGRILAAKTGTSTQARRKFANHGWNVIHGLARNRPFLLVVFVEKGSGGKEARTASEKIMKNLLK